MLPLLRSCIEKEQTLRRSKKEQKGANQSPRTGIFVVQ
jgi:hypothetical protein